VQSKFLSIDLDWANIDTVLLDMDGTLLDLHFDNYFWTDYIARCYAKSNKVPLERSHQLLQSFSAEVRGTLDWYCLDYWSEKLALDIVALKKQVDEKIAFRPNTIEFLQSLKARNKRIILATNAHPKTLELKLLRADFSEYFEALSSSHEIGFPKEEQAYWQRLTETFELTPSRCLFIDDSNPILDSAKRYGIGHLLSITQPDSQKNEVDCSPYTGIRDFCQLI
jgi:putative hydrolase of the HAD superfamily